MTYDALMTNHRTAARRSFRLGIAALAIAFAAAFSPLANLLPQGDPTPSLTYL